MENLNDQKNPLAKDTKNYKKIIFQISGIIVSLFLAWVAFLVLRSTIQGFTSTTYREINLILFVVLSIILLPILLPFLFSIRFRESFLKQLKEMNYLSFSSFFLTILGGSICSIYYTEDPGILVFVGVIGLSILGIAAVLSSIILSSKKITILDKILNKPVFIILAFLFASFVFSVIKYIVFMVLR